MSDELSEAAPAESIAVPVVSEAPAAEPSEQTTEIGREMEAVHDELRPPPQPRVKGQFASNKQPVARPEGMPVAWGNDKAQIWERLDPEARAIVAQREAEATGKITELGRSAKASESYGTLYEQFKEHIPKMPDGNPMPPQQAFHQLLSAAQMLDRDPVGGIRQLAQAYGVDLGTAAPAQNQQQLLQEATQELDRMLGQQRTAVERRTAAIVEKFQKGKEDHWDEIAGDLKTQIRAIQLSDPDLTPKEVLETAYDRALKLNDSIRQRLDVPKAKKAAEERATEDKRKADEARRLSSLNVGNSRTGVTPRSSKNIEAELEEVYDRVTARR